MCRQDRLTREARGFGAAIDAVAEAHELTVTHETTQHAQHLILTAEIAELARQEYVVAPFGDPRFHALPQCRLPAHGYPFLQKPDINYIQKPDTIKENI